MYDSKSSFNPKGYTFTKELQPGINSITPGPGAYEAKDEITKSGSKRATIGNS